ncbi:amidohydrolase family protein [Rhodopseudomonas palustris]|uniref:amidohydrolase family protein n=1 Tax=Rhodopseudomonas palustris TaxID=1076 RepID=UPI0020CB92D7|nr:amidohydrolase family protein [Rhodopseudomonas palustris]MCP9627907.1 amidohydrolase family protein [Rhodopseudomonas palustris]
MTFDLILRNAAIVDREGRADIGIKAGRFAAIEAGLPANGAPEQDCGGRLVVPGFVETHIHLDKSCLLGRCNCEQGSLDEAIAEVVKAKKAFTEEDVYQRASSTLEKAIKHGTNRIRTHVEVDPRVGLTSFRALKQLKADYAWAVDLQLCVFPQEGLLDDPGCDEVMLQALRDGADVVGGAPYMDKDSHGQIGRIFEMAKEFDVDIDFHLDFGLDPAHLDLDEVCRMADATKWGGRVAIGHVTKLSAMPSTAFEAAADRLASAGVAVTVLPATDLFLTGRDSDANVPRGVTSAHRLRGRGVNANVSTNNVLNPFTPFGDCSLIRMINLYANVTQVAATAELSGCLDMVTSASARLLNLKDYGIAIGNPADLVVLDCATKAQAVCEIAQPLFGLKRGLRTFDKPAAMLHKRN